MSEDHRSYFLARAEDEILAAECAEHPDAARAHFLLAGYYLDLAYNPKAQNPHRPETRSMPPGVVRSAMFGEPGAPSEAFG